MVKLSRPVHEVQTAVHAAMQPLDARDATVHNYVNHVYSTNRPKNVSSRLENHGALHSRPGRPQTMSGGHQIGKRVTGYESQRTYVNSRSEIQF